MGGYFACRELEGGRAARVLTHKAQLCRHVQIVYLDDHAVGFIRQFVAARVPRFGIGDGGFNVIESFGRLRDGKAECF